MTSGQVLRVLAGVMITVVALFFLAIGLVASSLSSPAPPDVAAQANAPATRADDGFATARIDSQLTRLAADTSWADQLGTSVVDLCRSQFMAGWFGPDHWQSVLCQRITTVYLAFDGDIKQRVADLRQTVSALGQHWSPFVEDTSLQPPIDVDLEYASASAAHADLTVRVGQVSEADPGAVSVNSWDDPSSRPPATRPFADEAPVYLTWHPVNAPALVRATTHRYVADFSFVTTYYTQPQPAPVPTFATSPHPTCRSGSDDCG